MTLVQPRTLGSAFADFCEAAPGATAFESADGKTRLSRSDFRGWVASAATTLSELPEQARIILALPNGPEFAAWFWACQVAGVVPVPVEPFRSGSRMLEQLDIVGRIAAVTDAKAVIAVDDGEIGQLLANRSLGLVHSQISASGAELPLTNRALDDLALIQFTSGSTGDPKGCALSNASVYLNARACLKAMSVKAGDASFTWMPFHHDMGLMSGVTAPVLGHGISIMETPRGFMLDPLGWLRKMSRFPRIHTTAPNFALALALRASKRRHDLDFSLAGVRSIMCGAEPIDPDLVREFMSAFEPYGLDSRVFIGCYGMAEATVLVSACAGGMKTAYADKHALEKLGRFEPAEMGPQARELVNLGRPVAGGTVAIGGPAESRPDREVGEIWLRSPCVMSGYFGNQAATSTALEDGWLRTGDNGFTVNGDIYFVGRKKEVLIVSGQNLDPHDIELRLSAAVNINARRLCATEIDIPGRGSSLVIAIEEDNSVRSRSDLEPAIIEACFAITGVRPWVKLLNGRRLPRTSSGKLQRSTVADWCREPALNVLAS